MGTRETQRRAWREAVAYGNWCWQQSYWSACMSAQRGGLRHVRAYRAIGAGDDDFELREALSAPKPWTRPAKADLGDEWVYRTREALRRKRRAAQRRGR